jgi:hypothetical protein
VLGHVTPFRLWVVPEARTVQTPLALVITRPLKPTAMQFDGVGQLTELSSCDPGDSTAHVVPLLVEMMLVPTATQVVADAQLTEIQVWSAPDRLLA